MPISFKCPQCGKVYKNLSDKYAGKKTKCKCGKVLILGAAKPAPTQPAAPVPVQPTVVQPTTVQPAPVQPIPVQPVPVQPVAPAPIHQAQPVGDPLFGPPPQAGGSAGDLLGQAAPPANDPLVGFHGGYAPPAPMAHPQPARKRSRRRSSGGNPAGPILSIIGGVLGLILGVTLAIISIKAMMNLLDVWSMLSDMGVKLDSSAKGRLTGAFVLTVLNILAAIAMAGAGGYSLVLGILELTNDYRKSIASKLALIVSAVFSLLVIITMIINIVSVSGKSSSLGRMRGRGFSGIRTYDVADYVLYAFLLLIIPAFVIFVGIFRWNDDSK